MSLQTVIKVVIYQFLLP